MALTITEAGGLVLRVNQGGPGVLTLTGVQSMTNKTMVNPIMAQGYTEQTYTANSGSAFTVDFANGSLQIITLTANCTYTFPTPTAGRSFTLIQKQDATGGRTATFPASVLFPNGTPVVISSTANKADKLHFTADGTNWFCTVSGKGY